jgi:hypothetical protein
MQEPKLIVIAIQDPQVAISACVGCGLDELSVDLRVN